MTNNDKNGGWVITFYSSVEKRYVKVPVSKEFYDEYHRELVAHQKYEYRHGRCNKPKFYHCNNIECPEWCPYKRLGDTYSMDVLEEKYDMQFEDHFSVEDSVLTRIDFETAMNFVSEMGGEYVEAVNHWLYDIRSDTPRATLHDRLKKVIKTLREKFNVKI